MRKFKVASLTAFIMLMLSGLGYMINLYPNSSIKVMVVLLVFVLVRLVWAVVNNIVK